MSALSVKRRNMRRQRGYIPMEPDFEKWALGEIAYHQREAEQLQSVLKKFLASRASAQRNTVHNAMRTSMPREFPMDDSVASERGDKRRNTSNMPILSAIEAAGPNGLDLDQIVDAAVAADIHSSRNAIRAFCWNEKQRGRLISSHHGRYVSVKYSGQGQGSSRQTNEAADILPFSGGSAASSTPNNAVARGEVAHDNMTT